MDGDRILILEEDNSITFADVEPRTLSEAPFDESPEPRCVDPFLS